MVIDCPTDGSEKVCEKYASIDSRIKLIYNSSNLHIGFSRNKGIEHAQGEFIGFTDHDDYCEPMMFEALYKAALKSNSEIAFCNIIDENCNKTFSYDFPIYNDMTKLNEDIFKSLIEANQTNRNHPSVSNGNAIWNKIYKKDFLTKNLIYFTDNRKVTIEDVIFSIKSHYFAKKIIHIPKSYYHHVSHNSNTFASYDYLSLKKIIQHILEIEQFLQNNNIFDTYKTNFSKGVVKRLYTSCINEYKHYGIKAYLRAIVYIRKNKTIQTILYSASKSQKNTLTLSKSFFKHLIKSRAQP